MKLAAGLLLLGLTFGQARPTRYHWLATAFSLHGVTAAGTRPHSGTVAADSAVLPLGTRIRVSGAGAHSGTYVVSDTGSKVLGRHIDIYMPSQVEARQFGKRRVWITVLRWGDGKK